MATANKKSTSKTQNKSSQNASSAKKNNVKERNVKMPEIKGIILLFIGIFLLFCAYFGSGGAVGDFLTKWLVVLFGSQGRTAIAIALVVHGIMLFARARSFTKERGALFLALLVLNITTVCGLVNNILNNNESFFAISTYRYIVDSGAPGGVIGQLLSRLYINLLSYTGAWLLIICVSIIMFLIIFRNSLFDKFRENFNKRSEEKKRQKELERKEKAEQLAYPSFGLDANNNQRINLKNAGLNSFADDEREALTHSQKDLSKRRSKLDSFENTSSKNFNGNKDEQNAKKPHAEDAVTVTAAKPIDTDIDENGVENEKNTAAKGAYVFPPIKLLDVEKGKTTGAQRQEVVANASHLEKTLRDFGIEAKVTDISMGPTVTRYELQLQPGIRVSKVVSLADDIAMALAAQRVRIEAPIPGKSAIGIEVPNKQVAIVKLAHILSCKEFKNNKSPLAVALGKDLTGDVLIMDIAKMPHILIAGETGSGKSVCLHAIIMSILFHSTPDDVRMILIDPKMVEFPEYNDIPHLLIPVVTDVKLAASSLAWAVREMTSRYEAFAENKVRDIAGYNEKMEAEGKEKYPRIVLIIDELNDLMMVSAQQVENSICRLAQLARAAGIHLVLATQRPSVNVITGTIKVNIPSRISFSVSSQTDSRTILDMGGAEKLLGKGDMLYLSPGAGKPIRAQCAFISEKEVAKVVEFIKKNQTADYDDTVSESIENGGTDSLTARGEYDDELVPQAMKIAFEKGEISTSMIQRKLKLGYARAGRIIDEMEERGFISERQGSNPRRVLISYEEFFNSDNEGK